MIRLFMEAEEKTGTQNMRRDNVGKVLYCNFCDVVHILRLFHLRI